MNSEIVNLILWIPVGVAVLISGLIFCINAYRKGLYHAIANLCATVVAAALTAVLSNLLGMLLSDAMVKSTDFMGFILMTVAKLGISLVLFLLLMPLMTLIVNLVAKKCVKPNPAGPKKWQKFSGLAVGLVCTLVFSLFWLSPLYGTVAVYGDCAAPMLEVLEMDEEPFVAEVQQILEEAGDHPVVIASGVGPVRWVHQGTTLAFAGGKTMQLDSMAESVAECIHLLNRLSQAETQEASMEILAELVDYVRNEAIYEDWLYALYLQFLSSAENSLEPMPTISEGKTFNWCGIIMDEDGDGQSPYCETMYGVDEDGKFYEFSYVTGDKPYAARRLNSVFVDEDGDGIGITEDPAKLPYVIIDDPQPFPSNIEDYMDGDSTVAVSNAATLQKKTAAPEQTRQPDVRRDALKQLHVSQEVFVENMENLCDFLAYALAVDVLPMLENGDMEGLYQTGIVERAGVLANSSEEAVAVKKILTVSLLLDMDCSASISQALIRDYEYGRIMEPARQTQEAAVLLQVMSKADTSVDNFVAKHPLLGPSVWDDLSRRLPLMSLLDLNLWEKALLSMLMQEDPQLEARLQQMALSSDASLTAHAKALVLFKSFQYDFPNCEDLPVDAVAFALEYFASAPPLNKDSSTGMALTYEVYKAYPQALVNYPQLLGKDRMDYYDMVMTYSWNMQSMYILLEDLTREQADYYTMEDATWSVCKYGIEVATSPETAIVMQHMVQTRGEDPLQLRAMLSDDKRQAFEYALDALEEQAYVDVELWAGGADVYNSYCPLDLENCTREEVEEYNRMVRENLPCLRAFLGM